MGPERKPTRQTREDRFARQSTEVAHVQLRKERGTEVVMFLPTLAQLIEISREYHDAKIQEKVIGGEQSVRHEEIVRIAQGHPGFRGVVNEQTRVALTVYPRDDEVKWDEKLLREGLGSLFSAVAGRRYTLGIPTRLVTPVGEVVDAEQIWAIIKKTVVDTLGLPEEDVVRSLNVEPKLDVDEPSLFQLIAQKRVTLPEGTRTVGKVTWVVTTTELKP